jgi:hypothetical protein
VVTHDIWNKMVWMIRLTFNKAEFWSIYLWKAWFEENNWLRYNLTFNSNFSDIPWWWEIWF